MNIELTIEMEKKLLSAMMLKESKVIPDIITIVTAEDFYRVEHRLIYRALLAVYETGTPPDVILVEKELRRTGDIDKVNRRYLFTLIDYEFTTSRAETYAKEIHNSAILRRMLETCTEIKETIETGEDDVEKLVELTEKKMFAYLNQKKSPLIEIKDPAQDELNRLFEAMVNPESLRGVPTGLIALDKVTNGLQKSDLILLAARPSMGKTALALNIAWQAARKGKVVAIFSLEMGIRQLTQRFLSMISGVRLQGIKTGQITQEEFETVTAAADSLAKLKIYVDDTSGQSLREIRTEARRLLQTVGLDLIVIDYIQLMQGVKAENRVQEVSAISRGLKVLARELNVPILALSQLSRAVELRAEKKPQLSDLRDSGSLEQDADIVMMLYREEYYSHDEADSNTAELNIAKNRNGETKTMPLYFNKETQLFGDLTKETNYE